MAGRLQRRYAEGTWLAPRLIAFASALGLVASIASLALLFASATGTVDVMGRPLGTDFSSFWSAGRLALEGLAPQAYDWATLSEMQRRTHGVDLFYPWSYPPVFLVLAAAVATLPYLPALIVWQGLTLIAAVLVFRVALPNRLALLAGLGSPTVLNCLGHGQTGFLTAALLAGGILALPRRQVLAGVLLGLLAYKPQFGILIPLVLAVGGYWRAIAAAAATVVVVVGLTLMLWGQAVWDAFIGSLATTQGLVLEGGSAGFEKFQSIFGWVRLVGGSPSVGYALQILVAAAAAAACVWLWRQDASYRLKGAGLIVGTLLSTPYVLDYDFVALGMALALLVAHGLEQGFFTWEKTFLALAWLVPGGARVIGKALYLPVGFLLLVAVLGLVLAHARSGRVSARLEPGLASS